MRDNLGEHKWVNHPIIGYVPLDENGEPYQPIVGNHYHKRKKPVTIYKTMDRAASYSPVESASEVRMFRPVIQENY